MNYNKGDIIFYHTFGGGGRMVKVDDKSPDIKNGRPGFDATVIEGPSRGQSVWGYDDQISTIVERAGVTALRS